MWELKQLRPAWAYPLGTSSLTVGPGHSRSDVSLAAAGPGAGQLPGLVGCGGPCGSTPVFSDWVRQSLEGRYGAFAGRAGAIGPTPSWCWAVPFRMSATGRIPTSVRPAIATGTERVCFQAGKRPDSDSVRWTLAGPGHRA